MRPPLSAQLFSRLKSLTPSPHRRLTTVVSAAAFPPCSSPPGTHPGWPNGRDPAAAIPVSQLATMMVLSDANAGSYAQECGAILAPGATPGGWGWRLVKPSW